MNTQEIANAMIDMASNDEMRMKMGEAGYNRVHKKYRIDQMRDCYREIYNDFY